MFPLRQTDAAALRLRSNIYVETICFRLEMPRVRLATIKPSLSINIFLCLNETWLQISEHLDEES